jgi:hypothetical protein
VDLTIQGNRMMNSPISPTVRLNGWQTKLGYGRHLLPVPPGPMRVDIETQWTRVYGHATTEFVTVPGQTVPLFYAAPHHVFADGAIGPVPQKRGGLGVAILIVSLAVAVPLTLLGLTIVALNSIPA